MKTKTRPLSNMHCKRDREWAFQGKIHKNLGKYVHKNNQLSWVLGWYRRKLSFLFPFPRKIMQNEMYVSEIAGGGGGGRCCWRWKIMQDYGMMSVPASGCGKLLTVGVFLVFLFPRRSIRKIFQTLTFPWKSWTEIVVAAVLKRWN